MHITARLPISTHARQSYLVVSILSRGKPNASQKPGSAQCRHSSSYDRNDFANQGFTGIYEPGTPTAGPLGDASNIGAPHITPILLKQHLDSFVVGQDRAKKILATAVYNHYQRIQEMRRREEEEEELLAKEERRRIGELRRHPVEGRENELKKGIAVPSLTKSWVEDEFPGQHSTVNVWPDGQAERTSTFQKQYHKQFNHQNSSAGPQEHSANSTSRNRHSDSGVGSSHPPSPLNESNPLTIEKSNILLLGPSGVGKTLMAKTLARVLEVPFSISDCTPFTQAGYIGEDADACVQRLLVAANYDVARAERGIICLDEIDKIATARVSHGKDVSGEGVQQALLKIIEGTTLQIQAKQERGSGGSPAKSGSAGSWPTNSPLGGGNSPQGPSSGGAGGKSEFYNVRTDNILFICAGAFNGLHKLVLDRIGRGPVGFGAPRKPAPKESSGFDVEDKPHETVFGGDEEVFTKHLPFYTPKYNTEANSERATTRKAKKQRHNTLDLVTTTDLQKFGLIPELIGRLPITTALHSLDTESLVAVLTEPRNSLLKQYKQLFALSSIDLHFTTPALHVIASTAVKMSTGARGLRTVMEGVLADAMFETPGSGVRHVVVDREVARREKAVIYFGRGDGAKARLLIAQEEQIWEEECRKKREEEGEDDGDLFSQRARNNSKGGAAKTFEEYREKASAAGF